ncbi:MAG: putative N-acetyltransferase YjcF [Chlamydiae bacterium]|nr:putative N-acetyltransferase YjcF [Chlamydiota bacterium]
MKIFRVSSDEDYQRCLEIRRKVFIEEQGVDEDIEIDAHEKEAIYFLAEIPGTACATGRFRPYKQLLKFERIATLPEFRGKGIAKALMKTMQEVGYKEYPHHLQVMNAQEDAIPFYEKLGWVALGEPFFEAEIPHKVMIFPPS